MPDDTDETPPRPVAPETPAEFKAAADWYRGRARFHSLMAEQARQMAETFERRAGLARAGTLPRVADASKVSGNMVTDRRLAISKGRTGKDKFAVAYRKAGYTLRSLAAAVECSHTMLSMHRKDPDRKIPRSRAEAIAKKIDWPADRAHWPFGFAP